MSQKADPQRCPSCDAVLTGEEATLCQSCQLRFI